ncbi:hypothetical protein B0H10DRAFT_1950542 [Mycena sp. CBHHK59/15]|nr:hypothetical protein B0H10DRAFT_1950542 [Mycena sp. CBHHK59/15]
MKTLTSMLFLSISLASGLNIQESSARIRAPETCGDPSDARPFYRSYNSAIFDHFYTTDVTIVNRAVQNAAYSLQSVAGLVFITHASATDNFYTMSTTERDNAMQNGYVSVAGDPVTYIYPTQLCGSIPLYRLYSATRKDNFYTTSESERSDFISNQQYTDIEIAGYVLPVSSGDSVQTSATQGKRSPLLNGLVNLSLPQQTHPPNHLYSSFLPRFRRISMCLCAAGEDGSSRVFQALVIDITDNDYQLSKTTIGRENSGDIGPDQVRGMFCNCFPS